MKQTRFPAYRLHSSNYIYCISHEKSLYVVTIIQQFKKGLLVIVLDCVPFKEFLVKPDPNYTEPAEYISKIKAPPDWEIIFQRDSLLECSGQVESSEPYSVLDNFDKLRQKCKAILDDTQLRAVELALRNKVMLIQVMIRNTSSLA